MVHAGGGRPVFGEKHVNEMQGRTATQSRRTAWLIVFLLFLAQMLNYFDKTVVGVAATSIMAELDLTPERYGLVASAFFSLYAVTGVLVALFAAPRFKPRSIMAVLLVIWSLAQLPVLVSASFTTLIAGRVILGMGEGPGTPTSINACHEWFAPAERNMPTALSLFGSQVGSLLAAPILSYIIAVSAGGRRSWRAAAPVSWSCSSGCASRRMGRKPRIGKWDPPPHLPALSVSGISGPTRPSSAISSPASRPIGWLASRWRGCPCLYATGSAWI